MAGDGDLEGSGWHGDSDIWIIKINFFGDILWQKCYGGSNFENAFRILKTTDGNFIVFGRTCSHDGDVSFNPSPGIYDPSIWIFKISHTGDLLWEQCIGGAGAGGESLEFGVCQKSDYQYVIAGNMTYSPSYDVNCSNHINNGRSDFWIFEITDTSSVGIKEPSISEYCKISIQPNPAREVLNFKVSGLSLGKDYSISIYDIFGREVQKIDVQNKQNEVQLNVESFSPGVYIAILKNGLDILESRKFIIAR